MRTTDGTSSPHRFNFRATEYLALNGLGRVFIENWRVNDQVLFGLTEPQLIGVGLIIVGITLWIHFDRADRRLLKT